MAADNCSSNSSYVCSDNSISGTFRPWLIAAVVIITVIVLLGVPANVAVIVKLSRHLCGSSMTQRLFFNLAVSDLLCLLCLPVGMVVVNFGYALPHGVCQLIYYFFCLCLTCDLNILVLISIQRYYQVLYPQKWRKVGQTTQRLLLFTVWILGALIALPVVFLTEDVDNKNGHSDMHACRNYKVAPAFQMVYVIFVVFSNFVLLFFYLLLVRGVKRTQIPNRKQPRVTKLFIRIIAVSLAVGLVPFIVHVLDLIANISGSREMQHISKKLTFAACLYFFNHCLNPFLYFFASRQSRTDGNKSRCLFMPLHDNS